MRLRSQDAWRTRHLDSDSQVGAVVIADLFFCDTFRAHEWPHAPWILSQQSSKQGFASRQRRTDVRIAIAGKDQVVDVVGNAVDDDQRWRHGSAVNAGVSVGTNGVSEGTLAGN